MLADMCVCVCVSMFENMFDEVIWPFVCFFSSYRSCLAVSQVCVFKLVKLLMQIVFLKLIFYEKF